MKVITHTERCIASGACVLASPAGVRPRRGWHRDAALDDAPAESEYESVREAARACPATVIELQ